MSGRGKNKKAQFYEEAKSLYVESGYTIFRISNLIGVSATTLYKWAKDGEWERLKREISTTEIQAFETLKRKLIKIINDLDNTNESAEEATLADKLAKLQKTLTFFEKEKDALGEIARVLVVLREFLIEKGLQKEMELLDEALSEFMPWAEKRFAR